MILTLREKALDLAKEKVGVSNQRGFACPPIAFVLYLSDFSPKRRLYNIIFRVKVKVNVKVKTTVFNVFTFL